jgi:hypothetical protein
VPFGGSRAQHTYLEISDLSAGVDEVFDGGPTNKPKLAGFILMAALTRSFWCLARIGAIAVWLIGGRELGGVKAELSAFSPAYFERAEAGKAPALQLFILDGVTKSVTLPAGPLEIYNVVGFGPDGTVIYGQPLDPRSQSGIAELDLNSGLARIVPGSKSLGTVWDLTVVRPTRKILVSGFTIPGECGTFEIDPHAGTLRTILAGPFPDCGGAGGPISPDGKHILHSKGDQLSMLDLESGTIRPVGVGIRESEWSPDGRWLACNRSGNVILIGADARLRPKNLGRYSGGPLVWSPDSKQLLVTKSQASCWTSLYGSSLEVIDVTSGQRNLVKASHCRISGGAFGWVRSGISDVQKR